MLKAVAFLLRAAWHPNKVLAFCVLLPCWADQQLIKHINLVTKHSWKREIFSIGFVLFNELTWKCCVIRKPTDGERKAQWQEHWWRWDTLIALSFLCELNDDPSACKSHGIKVLENTFSEEDDGVPYTKKLRYRKSMHKKRGKVSNKLNCQRMLIRCVGIFSSVSTLSARTLNCGVNASHVPTLGVCVD